MTSNDAAAPVKIDDDVRELIKQSFAHGVRFSAKANTQEEQDQIDALSRQITDRLAVPAGMVLVSIEDARLLSADILPQDISVTGAARDARKRLKAQYQALTTPAADDGGTTT